MEIKRIKEEIISLFRNTLPNLPADFIFEINIPSQSEMGDLTLSCFSLAKELKKPPEEIAQEIAGLFGKKVFLIDLIDEIRAVGPYLNIFLNKSLWFEIVLQEIFTQCENIGDSEMRKEKKFLIEYSAPNTNKPQHLGHLRNNFLGWTMAKILSVTGAEVIKLNLINDRGIHICKSMLAYQKWGDGKTPESEKMKGDHFVGQYYVLFNQKEKENPDLIIEAQEMLKQWEQGNPEILELWQKMNQWTLEGFKQTYKKIGVDFNKWYFESDIYNSGKKIILKALKRGLCYERDDKAIEIDLTKDGFDKKVLLRPDGTSVYITQDIGLAKIKQDDFNPDFSVYVVASEQDYHFNVLFRVLEIFGFDWIKNCYHLSYGLVFLPDGKLKSRDGKTADIDTVLAEMEQLAKGEIMSRDPNLSPQEISSRAEKISLGALKFFLLKYNPQQEVNFNPKDSISFEGDSGPYLQYTYARIQSILKKSPVKILSNKKSKKIKINYQSLGNLQEVEILSLLFSFSEIIEKSAINYNPSYLAHYLLKLAQKFNEFYHQHSVLKADLKTKKARLLMIMAVAEIIKKGLTLMGIEVMDEM